MREEQSRLIRIEVRPDSEQMLIATSPDLPKFEVPGLSYEDLAREVPAFIRDIFKLQHDQDVDVVPLEANGAPYPPGYSVRVLGRDLQPA